MLHFNRYHKTRFYALELYTALEKRNKNKHPNRNSISKLGNNSKLYNA